MSLSVFYQDHRTISWVFENAQEENFEKWYKLLNLPVIVCAMDFCSASP